MWAYPVARLQTSTPRGKYVGVSRRTTQNVNAPGESKWAYPVARLKTSTPRGKVSGHIPSHDSKRQRPRGKYVGASRHTTQNVNAPGESKWAYPVARLKTSTPRGKSKWAYPVARLKTSTPRGKSKWAYPVARLKNVNAPGESKWAYAVARLKTSTPRGKVSGRIPSHDSKRQRSGGK